MLRLSSGCTRLWTHYDVMDNTLMQARPASSGCGVDCCVLCAVLAGAVSLRSRRGGAEDSDPLLYSPQVVGSKRVVLWPPEEEPNLYCLVRSSLIRRTDRAS